jgi:hypothetical protein
MAGVVSPEFGAAEARLPSSARIDTLDVIGINLE